MFAACVVVCKSLLWPAEVFAACVVSFCGYLVQQVHAWCYLLWAEYALCFTSGPVLWPAEVFAACFVLLSSSAGSCSVLLTLGRVCIDHCALQVALFCGQQRCLLHVSCYVVV